MKIKISAMALAAIFLMSVFAACSTFSDTEETTNPGEEPTQTSDGDSVNIKDSFDFVAGINAGISEATQVKDKNEFEKALKDDYIKAISYVTEKNITLKSDEKITKPVYVSTEKKIKLDAPIENLIIAKAGKGFESKESIDALIISGEDITSEIRANAKAIYIEGKNAELHIFTPECGKIYANNVTAVIVNHSEVNLTVVLANGAKTEVLPDYTYSLRDNRVREGVFEAE